MADASLEDAAEPAIAAAAADAPGVEIGGVVSGWLATTDAEGKDGSEAGTPGKGAEAALGATTAVGAGMSGVCFVQPVATARAAIAQVHDAFISFLDPKCAHCPLPRTLPR